MLTAMTEEDWTIVLRVFAVSRSRRGDKGRNDRKFLEALHYFVVHNITKCAVSLIAARASKNASKVPDRLSRQNRFHTLFQCPNFCRCSIPPWCEPCEGDHKRSRKHSSFYIRSHDFQHLVH
jgi:hypothetical protein